MRTTAAALRESPGLPPDPALPVTEAGRDSRRAWWGEATLLALVAGMFGAISDEWAIAGAAALLAVLPPLVRRQRFATGPSVQALLVIAAGIGVYVGMPALSATRAGLPGVLNPFWTGTAVLGLAVAVPRAAMRAPSGGLRSSMALIVVTVVACGGTRTGWLYPGLALAVAIAAWHAVRSADPTRATGLTLPRRHRATALAMVAVGLGVSAGAANGLPALHDWMLRQLGLELGGARTGFGAGLQLGSLQDLAVSQKPVLRVEGPAPERLRGAVYTRYIKGRWLAPKGDVPREVALDTRRPEGVVQPTGGEALAIEPLTGERRYFLPLGAQAVARLGPPEDVGARVDRMGVLHASHAETAGPVRVVPTSQATSDGRAFAVASPTREDRVVPEGLAGPVGALARGWVAGAASDGEKVARVVEALARDYRYALEFEAAPGLDPLVDFLTRRKTGHCEYFASAGALTLRAVGVPARVVGGYRVTEQNPFTGWYTVREANAHAWVEAWVDGRWVEVDPTPPSELGAFMAAKTGRAAALWDAITSWLGRAITWLSARPTWEITAFGVLPLALLFAWLRYRRYRRERQLGRPGYGGWAAAPPSLDALLRGLARRGVERAPSCPLEDLATDLRGRPEPELERAGEVLARYASWRYGDATGAPPAELLAQLDEARRALRHPARSPG